MVLASNKWLNKCENVQKSVVTGNLYAIESKPITTNKTITRSNTKNSSSQPFITITKMTTTPSTAEASAKNDLQKATTLMPNIEAPTAASADIKPEITTNTIIITTDNANDDCSDNSKFLADSENELKAQLVLTVQEDEHKTYVHDNTALNANMTLIKNTITTAASTSSTTSNNCNINNNAYNNKNNKHHNKYNKNNKSLNEITSIESNITTINRDSEISNNGDNNLYDETNSGNCIELTNDSKKNSLQAIPSSFGAKQFPSNNWCSDSDVGSDGTQSAESYLNAYGVDISSIKNSTNIQQNMNKLQSAYLNEPKSLNSLCSTLTTVTTTASGTISNSIASTISVLGIKCSNSVENTNYLDIPAIDGASNNVTEQNGQAKIILMCESNSHPFHTRTILLTPNIECKVGRLMAKSKVSESNAIFDCKVLSRNHAVLWYSSEDKKFWVKDTKSSNGTFINDLKLGNDEAELHFGDIVKFGVDVVENTRKEVHGCIIASVKLYLPDGREAISIESSSNGRTSYSGEKFIAVEELHRLNFYVQEVSQREKNLKSKLCNMQNVLDVTRKNSGLCWQALIAEDQLLHRIHMLEKKIQIMEKNVPESTLRNEVIKLLDEKNSYQNTAKEALRKVYQERCEALQLVAKMESSFAQSENECKVLRDQVMSCKQCLQEVKGRLVQLETEYIEYKKDAQRQQQELKDHEDERVRALLSTIKERDLENEFLENKISELTQARANEEEAIQKLDAAIADVDVGDDDDENDEEDMAVEEVESSKHMVDGYSKKMKIDAVNDSVNGVDVVELNNSKNKRKLAKKDIKGDAKNKQATMLKWLENSEINKKESSLEIFNAICNESDSSDEYETLPSQNNESNYFQNLQTFYGNLLKLEADIEKETLTQNMLIDDAKELKETEILNGSNDKDDVNRNNYDLFKESLVILREAYNELIESQRLIKQQQKNFKLEPQLTLKEEEQLEETKFSLDNSNDKTNLLVTPNVSTENDINYYKQKITELTEKLNKTELESYQTLDMLQEESNSYKDKVEELTKHIDTLRAEKEAQLQSLLPNEHVVLKTDSATITENSFKLYTDMTTSCSSTSTTPTHSTLTATPTHAYSFEQELSAEQLFNIEREEELVLYKEAYDKKEIINLELQREIRCLKSQLEDHFLLRVLPFDKNAKSFLYILAYAVGIFAVLCALYWFI